MIDLLSEHGVGCGGPVRSSWYLAAALPVLLGISAGIARGQDISEFPIPTVNSMPSGIAAGPDGALWFTEGGANKIGQITTAGVITEFLIPTARSLPQSITRGPDDNLWFTEFSGNKIGRITTAGVITEFAIPTSDSGPYGIAKGPDGTLWFTENQGSKIGRITTAGVITEFRIPPDPAPSFRSEHPIGIAAGPDGALWFTEGNGSFQQGLIGRITTEGVITNQFGALGASSIIAGPDGALWFTTSLSAQIGRITTAGGITTFSVSTNGTTPLGNIVAGPDGALWFTDGYSRDYLTSEYSNKVRRITTTGAMSEFTIPTAGSVPLGIAVGPDGALWFTEYLGSKIGRITTGATCTPGSTSLCLNGGRFKVEVSWSVPSQGTSGVGTAVPLTGDTGAFWFFGSNNYELMVKVLDGRAFNGRFWVFSAPATNVRYTITVTDTVNNVVKTYTSLEGQVTNIQDTGGFLP